MSEQKTQAPNQLETLKAKVEALESIVVEKDGEIEALKAALEAKQDAPVISRAVANTDLPSFKIGNKSYKFTVGAFKIRKEKDGKLERVTGEEAAKDTELCKLIVKEGYNIFTEA